MSATGFLKVRVTKQQYERLSQDAETAGYNNLSQYVRDKLFEEDNRFSEIINLLLEIRDLCAQKSYKQYKAPGIRIHLKKIRRNDPR